MRLISRFPDQKQASALIDSLRDIGFDRSDLIVSTLAKDQKFETVEQAAKDMIFLKSERDGLNDIGTFADGVKGLKGTEGIIVAVELPKHEASKVRELMEQSGAVEIIQD